MLKQITWPVNFQSATQSCVVLSFILVKEHQRNLFLDSRTRSMLLLFSLLLMNNAFVSWLPNHLGSNDEMCYELAQCLKWLTQKKQPWDPWWAPSHQNNPLGHGLLLRYTAIILFEWHMLEKTKGKKNAIVINSICLTWFISTVDRLYVKNENTDIIKDVKLQKTL